MEKIQQKGCERCTATRQNWEEGGAHDFRIDDKSLFFYDSQLGWEGEQVSYCPWCGRKL